EAVRRSWRDFRGKEKAGQLPKKLPALVLPCSGLRLFLFFRALGWRLADQHRLATQLVQCLLQREVFLGTEFRHASLSQWFLGFFFKAFARFFTCFFTRDVFHLCALATGQVLVQVRFAHAQRSKEVAFSGF